MKCRECVSALISCGSAPFSRCREERTRRTQKKFGARRDLRPRLLEKCELRSRRLFQNGLGAIPNSRGGLYWCGFRDDGASVRIQFVLLKIRENLLRPRDDLPR